MQLVSEVSRKEMSAWSSARVLSARSSFGRSRHKELVLSSAPSQQNNVKPLPKPAVRTRSLNPVKEDVVKICRDLTEGKGVDIAFDAAGLANGNTLKMAIDATRSLGQITNIAIYGAPVAIDLHALYMGEKRLNGIIGYTAQDFKEVIQAVSEGKIKCDDMCTARIGLDDLVEGGFKELINNKEVHVKILVDHEK